jgi:hypothetical protein
LRLGGVKAIFNPRALVYHYKPPLRSGGVEKMVSQARAQARTAVQLVHVHPHWRAYLATGLNPPQRLVHAIERRAGAAQRYRGRLGDLATDRALSRGEMRAARQLANLAYFEELERALSART